MLISFFEEFPTAENLQKVKQVTWRTKVYLAAKSVSQFKGYTANITSKKVQEVVYWPILSRQEGYWISPFSERKALEKLFWELHGKNIPVMLDLELPTTQNPWLYLTQALNFPSNKKLITNFISTYQGQIYQAEYYPEGKRNQRLLQFLGLHYPQPKVKVIKMLYHSLHHFSEDFLRRQLQQGQQVWEKNFVVGMGTITKGIHGNEPRLSAQQLEKDLELAQKMKIQEVVLFRLGGLNKKYGEILKKYAQ
ncbi:TPA: hypothetical protein HA234_05345 [Candidatus Woesearchaeota archaeon]|nr:hypothetical protein [Candidatus Woesearchaeota archaeon]